MRRVAKVLVGAGVLVAVVLAAAPANAKGFSSATFTGPGLPPGGLKIDGPDRLLGQVVFSDTANPPSIVGDSGRGHAARFVYTRDKNQYDIWSQYFNHSSRFRADDGFIPLSQVHGADFEFGGHIYPKSGFASFIRPFVGGGKESSRADC